MIDLEKFKMNPAEENLLRHLVTNANPRSIAEFGCGLSTKLWAENSEAHITTWDNYPEWTLGIRAAFQAEPWLTRIDFRLYEVSPDEERATEKNPVAWEGAPFDFLFLDGPRSAHPTSPGRSGSFRFATQHAAPRALIVWHDADRPHEREMAGRYFGHCARQRRHNIGWCQWELPAAGIVQTLRKWKS